MSAAQIIGMTVAAWPVIAFIAYAAWCVLRKAWVRLFGPAVPRVAVDMPPLYLLETNRE